MPNVVTPSQLFNSRIVKIWKQYSCPLPNLSGSERFPMMLPEIGQKMRIIWDCIKPGGALSQSRHLERQRFKAKIRIPLAE